MSSRATVSAIKPVAPGHDKRWKIVDATMRRVGQNSRGLIETLHTEIGRAHV